MNHDKRQQEVMHDSKIRPYRLQLYKIQEKILHNSKSLVSLCMLVPLEAWHQPLYNQLFQDIIFWGVSRQLCHHWAHFLILRIYRGMYGQETAKIHKKNMLIEVTCYNVFLVLIHHFLIDLTSIWTWNSPFCHMIDPTGISFFAQWGTFRWFF